jgi:hypothetical protein
MAHAWPQAQARVVRTAAWYAKVRPMFSDALAVGRRELWDTCHFSMSGVPSEVGEIPRSLWERGIGAVCYAAWLDKVELRTSPIKYRFSGWVVSDCQE